MSTDSLRMILPARIPGRDDFYVAFTPRSSEQLVRVRALPQPLIVTGPSDLDAGQALSCGPLVINGKMFPVLHIRTAEETD